MGSLAFQLAVDEDKVTPGLLGFCVVAVLGIATWLLLRSMTNRLRRVDFEEGHAGHAETAESSDAESVPAARGAGEDSTVG